MPIFSQLLGRFSWRSQQKTTRTTRPSGTNKHNCQQKVTLLAILQLSGTNSLTQMSMCPNISWCRLSRRSFHHVFEESSTRQKESHVQFQAQREPRCQAQAEASRSRSPLLFRLALRRPLRVPRLGQHRCLLQRHQGRHRLRYRRIHQDHGYRRLGRRQSLGQLRSAAAG